MYRKSSKFIAFLFFLIVFSCILCGCGKSDQSEVSSADDVGLPELNIGTDMLDPFFFVNENGEYAGIDADLAREACRRAGYRPVFSDVPWNDRDKYLNDGGIDCIWSAFIKDGREDKYLWTDPYIESDLCAAVDMRSPDRSLDTLKNSANVALRSGSRAEDIILNDPGFSNSIYSCGSFEMAETAFVKGYASALVSHRYVLERMIAEYPGMYRLLDEPVADTHLAVAFRRGDEHEAKMMQDINDAIATMKDDGYISDTVKKYTDDITENDNNTEKEAADD